MMSTVSNTTCRTKYLLQHYVIIFCKLFIIVFKKLRARQKHVMSRYEHGRKAQAARVTKNTDSFLNNVFKRIVARLGF